MANDRAYFAGEGTTGGFQLWVTNGTMQGTHELPVPDADGDAPGLDPRGLTAFGNSVLFGGADANGLYNLYVSNGTAVGTTELTTAGTDSGGLFAWQFVQGHGGTTVTAPLTPSFTVLGSQALFTGVDANDLFQLWTTDGTSAGTHEIVVPTEANFGLHPSYITAIGSTAVFSGYDSAGNDALWVTDGSNGGTSELAPSVAPSSISAYGSRALFAGFDASGLNLWITDGTQAGTRKLTPGGAGAPTDPAYFAVFGTKDVFVATDASGRSELWITDGTSAGTHEIIPSAADTTGLFINYEVNSLTVLGNQVLFAGYGADGTRQLWVSNGTGAGTAELAVAGAASNGLDPSEITAIGNNAVFLGVDQSGDTSLWVTDGTAAGTHEVLPAGANGPFPLDLTSIGGEAVFAGSDASGRSSLWVTDGTTAGTQAIQTATVNTGAAGTVPPALSPHDFAVVVPTLANVYGATSGGSTINGTTGDDYIHGYGLGNTIYGNGGNDLINTGAGSATVYVGTRQQYSPNDGGEGLNETVNVGGSGNTITGGNEDFDIVGGTGNNTVNVGFGNNVISLFCSGNQVTLGSGVSTVRFTGGSATALLTDFGQAPAPVLYNVTVLFTGTGNMLYNVAGTQSHAGLLGDRGTLKVIGGSGSGNFDLAWSTATLVTGGTGNIVHAGQGVSDITPGSGSDTVDLEASFEFDQVGGDVTVHLAGQNNLVQGVAHTLNVTGGNGGGTFKLAGNGNESYIGFAPLTRSYTVTTGGANNTFALDGAFTNTIFTGYGGATVTVANPTVSHLVVPFAPTTIVVGRTANTVVGGDAPTTITGGIGSGSFTLGDGDDSITTVGPSNTIVVGNGADSIVAGTNLANVQAGDGRDDITIAGSGDTVVAGDGNDTVRGNASASHVTLGDGSDVFLLTGQGNFLTAGNGADSFTLAVNSNTVVAGNGDDTVTGGGGGKNSVTLGSGHDTVQMVGWGNNITVGAGVDSIEGGYGFATFSLTGSTATLALHDRNDMVTLNAATHATITDQSSNALLRVTASDVQAMIAGFGASTGAKLDLVGGVGGYSNAAQVLAALHGDGHGGSLLSLGATGFVDFTTVAPGALHAANFLF